MKNKSLVPSLLVFALVCTVRLAVLVHLNNTPYSSPASGGDTKFYTEWAFKIMSGHWTDHQAFYGLPGYAFLLAGIFSVVGFNPFFVGFIQAGLDGVVGVFMLQIVLLLLPGRRGLLAGSLAALGWAFFQPAQTFSAVLMPTSWLVFAFWGCVLWLMIEKKPSLWYPWLPLGICVGIVSTMVATILFVLPLAAAMSLVKLRPARKIVLALPLLLAGVFFGASPCWIHNFFIAKEPVLLTAHSGLNFYIGNNEFAIGYPKMPAGMRASQEGMLHDSLTIPERELGRHLTHAEVSQYWSKKANDFIHNHPNQWRHLMLIKMWNAWSARQYDDLSLIRLFNEEGILLPGLRFGIVAVLGLAGFVLAVNANRNSIWIMAAVLLHLASLMPVFITERYRLAAVPGLLILAGVGLCEFGFAFYEKKWWKPAVYLAVLGAAGIGIFWDSASLAIELTDRYNTGLLQCAAGNMEHARKNLEWAYAQAPNDPEVNFALGNFWMKQDHLGLSKGFFHNTLVFDPYHGGAYNNLAVIAMQEKNWQVAERCASNAQQIAPTDMKSYVLLALIYANLGKYDLAGASIAQAIQLRPEIDALKEMQQNINDHKIPLSGFHLTSGI